MTINTSTTMQPLTIQSSKLIDWLLNRKLLQKDYPKKISLIHAKIKHALSQTKLSADQTLEDEDLLSYLHSLKLVEIVQKEDTTTDFFGRSSSTVRAWKDIIDSYQKYNLHVAEVGETLQAIASEHVPKCKTATSDRQKLIIDLKQKIKEYSLKTTKKEEEFEKSCKEFHLNVQDKHFKLHLLEEASKIPEYLDQVVLKLNNLQSAVQLYDDFSGHLLAGSKKKSEAKAAAPERCATLKLLITSGHVYHYNWRFGGRAPDRVGSDDDFIPTLLNQENASLSKQTISLMDNIDSAVLVEEGGDSIDIDLAEYSEIDFGDIDLSNDIQLEIEVDDIADTHPSTPSQKTTEPSVAEGKDARRLLDTIEGRVALLNDLVELSAFLTRFIEDQMEIQGHGDDLLTSGSRTSASGGSHTLQHIILQNAPSSVQSISLDQAKAMQNAVESARTSLTNSSTSQLLMIRNKPGYLDRLVGRLTDLHNQANRANARVVELKREIQEAVIAQEVYAAQLSSYRNQGKDLVRFLEQELSRICNRPIQLIGHVLDM